VLVENDTGARSSLAQNKSSQSVAPKVSSALAFSLASCSIPLRLITGVYTSCSSSTRFCSSFGFWVELTIFSLDLMISLVSLSSLVSSEMVLCSCPISFSDWSCDCALFAITSIGSRSESSIHESPSRQGVKSLIIVLLGVALAATSRDANAIRLVELTSFSLDFMISLTSFSSFVSSEMVLCNWPISFSEWSYTLGPLSSSKCFLASAFGFQVTWFLLSTDLGTNHRLLKRDIIVRYLSTFANWSAGRLLSRLSKSAWICWSTCFSNVSIPSLRLRVELCNMLGEPMALQSICEFLTEAQE